MVLAPCGTRKVIFSPGSGALLGQSVRLLATLSPLRDLRLESHAGPYRVSFATLPALFRRIILHIVRVSSLRHAQLVSLILHRPEVPRFGFFGVLSTNSIQNPFN